MPLRLSRGVREYAGAVLLALVVALFVRAFVVQAFKIPSPSMVPTLLSGDHILVNKFLYGFRLPFGGARALAWREPRRGDVVVFAFPPDPSVDFVKRVVAVGGDTVEVREKRLFIDGKAEPDPHAMFTGKASAYPPGRDDYGPFTVPAGTVFVMGDNRDNSNDSRFWGPVPVSSIKGKAMVIYWSADASKPVLPWLRWPWGAGTPDDAVLFLPRASRLGMVVR
jgi:signal peptidase I